MPRPKTIGRCATRGCKGRWQLTPRNKLQRFCSTCAGARKRVRDREYASTRRFMRKVEAWDRADLIRMLAYDYEATGYLDACHDDGILAEARALGETMVLDDQYQEEMAVQRQQDAADEAADSAGKLARLNKALKVVIETRDALGERVVRERIAALARS